MAKGITQQVLKDTAPQKPSEKACSNFAVEQLTAPTPRKPYEYTPPPTPKVK